MLTVVFFTLLVTARMTQPAPESLQSLGQVPGQPYEQFALQDRAGRKLTIYVSERPKTTQSVPLVLYIQGPGCGSLFAKRGSQVVVTSGHGTFVEALTGRARVLIVEKVGVEPFVQQDECEKLTTFNEQHTLERWADALSDALAATRGLPGIAQDRLLVAGHSEGGVVAARLARSVPAVTHVALLAGEGPSQLFSLIQLARTGALFREISSDPEKRVNYVLDEWKRIQAEPDRADKFFLGFAYRRWSSFLRTSPLEELGATSARIYVAQGLDDRAVAPVSADVLFAQLVARGKAVTYERTPGADHSFNVATTPKVDGWRRQLDAIARWFLSDQ